MNVVVVKQEDVYYLFTSLPFHHRGWSCSSISGVSFTSETDREIHRRIGAAAKAQTPCRTALVKVGRAQLVGDPGDDQDAPEGSYLPAGPGAPRDPSGAGKCWRWGGVWVNLLPPRHERRKAEGWLIDSWCLKWLYYRREKWERPSNGISVLQPSCCSPDKLLLVCLGVLKRRCCSSSDYWIHVYYKTCLPSFSSEAAGILKSLPERRYQAELRF